MNIESSVDVIRNTISISILLITPIMTTIISVGLGVSLLQSVTSIQEQTLTFVPKLLAAAGVILVSSNWMIRTLVEFATGFLQKLPDMAK